MEDVKWKYEKGNYFLLSSDGKVLCVLKCNFLSRINPHEKTLIIGGNVYDLSYETLQDAKRKSIQILSKM